MTRLDPDGHTYSQLKGSAFFYVDVARKPDEVLLALVDSTVELAISPAIAPLKAKPRARRMEALRTICMVISRE